jgi:esterase
MSEHTTGPAPGHATSNFTIARGVRLHHLDHGGEGEPIILIHGVLGQAHMFDHLVPEIHDRGRILAPDLRGYGESQWDPAGKYTTESHAADMSAWMKLNGLSGTAFVGFSWGGLIGLHLAVTEPDLISKLVMVDIPPSFATTETEIPPIAQSFASHDEVMAAERRQNRFASDEAIETMTRFGTRPGPAGRLIRKSDPVFSERWPFRRDDRWSQMSAVEQPVLVVRAADSLHVSPQQAEQMKATLRDGRYEEIGQTGHLIPLENPVDLAAALRTFDSHKGEQG